MTRSCSICGTVLSERELYCPECQRRLDAAPCTAYLKGAGDERFVLARPQAYIGRHPDAEIRIDDSRLARRQALLRWTPEGWLLFGGWSSNPNCVNGVQLGDEPYLLKDGDCIDFAEIPMTFHVEDRLPAELPRS